MTEDEYRIQKQAAIVKWRQRKREYEKVLADRIVFRAADGEAADVRRARAELDCVLQRRRVDEAADALDAVSLTAEAQAFQVQTLAEAKLT